MEIKSLWDDQIKYALPKLERTLIWYDWHPYKSREVGRDLQRRPQGKRKPCGNRQWIDAAAS